MVDYSADALPLAPFSAIKIGEQDEHQQLLAVDKMRVS